MTAAHPLQHEAEALAAGLPALLVRAEKLAASISLGVHGRRKAGIGEDFWQFRRYATYDSAAAIDWRQSAKSQNLFVREREWDMAQSVWFWRDGSAGMRFSTTGTSKIERATLLTLALASLLIRGGERIALLGEGRGPAHSRAALRRIAHALIDLDPADEALPPSGAMPRHSQFVWVSDFLSPLERLEARMHALAQSGVIGHLVHIIDPAEEDFPYRGRTKFELADGSLTETLGRAESVAAAYRARFRAHGEALAALSARLGWNYLAHRTDRAPQAALIALYANMSGL